MPVLQVEMKVNENTQDSTNKKKEVHSSFLNALTDHIWEHYENNNNNQTNHNNGQLLVYADRDRIQQVISNLLSNADKFTENGKITVKINKTENDINNNKQQVKISVHDEGKGIDKEILPRLYEKFATKSRSGTGLGLYISKNIVESHNGSIRGYNNKEGNGATFEFTIPLEKTGWLKTIIK